MLNLEKFVLKVFNRLSYNCEVSGLLIAGFLSNLLDYYTPHCLVKTINIFILGMKFILLIFGQNCLNTNDIVRINKDQN